MGELRGERLAGGAGIARRQAVGGGVAGRQGVAAREKRRCVICGRVYRRDGVDARAWKARKTCGAQCGHILRVRSNASYHRRCRPWKFRGAKLKAWHAAFKEKFGRSYWQIWRLREKGRRQAGGQHEAAGFAWARAGARGGSAAGTPRDHLVAVAGGAVVAAKKGGSRRGRAPRRTVP